MKKIINLILIFLLAISLSSCLNTDGQESNILIPEISTKPKLEVDPFSDLNFKTLFGVDFREVTDEEIKNRKPQVIRDFIGIDTYNYQYHSLMSHTDAKGEKRKLNFKEVYSYCNGRELPIMYEHNILESHIPNDQRIEEIEAYYKENIYYEKRNLNDNVTYSKEALPNIPTYIKGQHKPRKIEEILLGNFPELSNYLLELAIKDGKTYVRINYLLKRYDSKPRVNSNHQWIYAFNSSLDVIAFFHSENTVYIDDDDKGIEYITYQEICYPYDTVFELPDVSNYK